MTPEAGGPLMLFKRGTERGLIVDLPPQAATRRANEFVLKIDMRCNLACDYCYMYYLKDDSYTRQPDVMSLDVVDAFAGRVAEHVPSQSGVSVTLHGGEPLLAGAEHIDETCRRIKAKVPNARFNVQTNGIALRNQRILEVLGAHSVSVGVSLDGGPEVNDEHRTFRNGRGSYNQVETGIRTLQNSPHRRLFSGILCQVLLDTKHPNDPVQTYEALRGLNPPEIDFLFPLANWDEPPFGHEPGKTPYADWLIQAYDHHISLQQAGEWTPRVRLFESISNPRGRMKVETVGGGGERVVVIAPHGGIERVDTLRSTYNGAAATNYNVFDHSFSEVLDDPKVYPREWGVMSLLNGTCQACPIVRDCRGGKLEHRYSSQNNFNNPSVYCEDFQKLVPYIKENP